MHASPSKILHNQYGESQDRRPSRRELMDDFFDGLEDRIQSDMALEAEAKYEPLEGAL